MINYKSRINNLRNYMRDTGIDMCFLPRSGEQDYLTGFPKGLNDLTYANSYGDWAEGIYIFLDKIFYLVPQMTVNLGHAPENIYGIIDDYVVISEGVSIIDTVRGFMGHKLNVIKKIAVTKNAFSTTLMYFKELIPEAEYVSLEEYVNNLKMIKTDYELSKIKEACKITDEVFSEVVPLLKIGMSDIDVKAEIDRRILLKGCEGNSFHTGVLISGGSNKTHWSDATGSIIMEGCTVAFDFGVMKDGFCSDFGRTVYAGEPTKEMVRIHEAVIEAQGIAIEAMIPGRINCEELNLLARQYLKNQGLIEGFRHRLGHSIGRDVHEYPYLMPGYKELLQKNMTFTIEPSVIIDDVLLIRVEDIVAVGDNGGVPLSNYTKDIIVI